MAKTKALILHKPIEGHKLITDRGQDTRKPGGLKMTLNLGKCLKKEEEKKEILIAQGGSLTRQFTRDHKTNSGTTGNILYILLWPLYYALQ